MNSAALPHLTAAPGPAGVAAVTQALRALLSGASAGVEISTVPAAPQQALPVAAEPVVVLATSGTAGTPRRVVIPFRSLLASATAGAEVLGPPGPWLTAVPVTGVGGLLTVLRTLLAGAEPTPWPGVGGAASFTPDGFVAAAQPLLDRVGPGSAYLSVVPTQLHRLLSEDSATRTAARFTAVLVGGAAMAPGLRTRAAEAGITVVSTYGATETCGGVVYDGVSLPGVSVAIEPDDSILIGGPTIASHYADDPDDERLGGGVFHTGDLGRWEHDRLQVLGRRDHVIKSGGIKVSLAAVERIARSVPGVVDAAAVAVPSDEWGTVAHLDVQPAADLPDSQGQSLLDAVKRAVVDRLGPAARPHTMTLVSEIPTTASGKPLLRRDR